MSTRPFILDPLFQSVKSVTGVGPRLTKLLEKLTGPCVVHLLWHLPVDVIDRRYSPALRDARGGQVATLQVTVLEHIQPKRRGLPYRVKCGDGTGSIDLTFFNVRGDYLDHQLPVGTQRVVSGRLEFYNGYLQMPHPDFIVAPIDKGQIPPIEPIYPMTAGITHKVIYKIIRAALMRAGVAELEDHPHVAEIRQAGMILAIEMVRDRASRTPYPWQERRGLTVYRHGLSRGVLLRPLGPVVYFMPPYVIDEEDIALMARTAIEGIELATRAS